MKHCPYMSFWSFTYLTQYSHSLLRSPLEGGRAIENQNITWPETRSSPPPFAHHFRTPSALGAPGIGRPVAVTITLPKEVEGPGRQGVGRRGAEGPPEVAGRG